MSKAALSKELPYSNPSDLARGDLVVRFYRHRFTMLRPAN
jgi:hypothetical protein